MSAKVIIECPLPEGGLPPGSRSDYAESLTLGEAYIPVPPPSLEGGEVLDKQYLVDLSYVQDSESYFSTIEAELRKVSDVTLEVCLDYWENLKEGQAACRKLIDSISKDDLIAAINDPKNGKLSRQGATHCADPDTPNGVAYLLAAFEHFFFSERLPSISFTAFRHIPFLQRVCSSEMRRNQAVDELRRILKQPSITLPDLLIRSLGLMTTRDCAVATAILMHQQPRFNTWSLHDAEAYDKNGKLRMSLTDAGGEQLWFTVAKLRAKAQKGGILTKLASTILSDVHLMTRTLRVRLMTEQPNVARQLFLVVSRFGVGCVTDTGANFNHKEHCLYSQYEQKLLSAGITRSTFTLGKVRNTQGILVWLETESLLSMAAAMGNSIKTVLTSYIPDWLYHRMLANTARHTHQKIIVLATAGSKWQLAASDFSTIAHLQKFIVKVLSDGLADNSLDELFRQRFAHDYPTAVPKKTKSYDGTLYVSLDSSALAALEVYVKHASSAPFILESKDEAGAWTFKELTKLYQLIYSVAHAENDEDVEGIVVELVSGGSQARLKMLWRQSRPIVKTFEQLVNKV
ncbi:hypothetical protein AO256_24780 [Pseudomonas syringae]|nr:hypothetical protein AO256_24780 [Pseudomonas syringae]